ncbi:ExbD/TolR family protein [Cellvibrio japonicus]|uniref:ExbD/TolR family protein n=1 Tax=Cellvibrio japonicus (strain Ueda107) TaxID=498211 RepID=B3PFR7_CELJU|nr:biopolymer transporter ExbD [Cellvibrio japonicus]ACE84501.1 ExbD/TolR family protein [Cellvibrio japonicus Ueda107]QEI12291.1 biopolymer transporter ExbD [Cellvibrio japonicus]QEI15865.1 biopolymer transporter ExbD [Cellvibrio japonicus]QEI19443.1 biopolymer transporter ExbD [Cellvibrio japonicus]
MKFQRQKVDNDGINLTPLIDVVFLLLIFFMVSTTFTRETHLSVDLPEATGKPSSDTPKLIEILIAADGSYSVNGKVLVNSKPETLRVALEKTAEGDNRLPLAITADAKTPHQFVVAAMDVAGQLGFSRLSITSRQPDPQAP